MVPLPPPWVTSQMVHEAAWEIGNLLWDTGSVYELGNGKYLLVTIYVCILWPTKPLLYLQVLLGNVLCKKQKEVRTV